MNTTRRILSVLLAAVLTLALCVTAFAADTTPTTTITVDDDATATYAGFLLMTSTDDGEGHIAYVVNPAYGAAIKEVLGLDADASNEAVVAAVAAKTADETRAFADAVYAKIGAGTPDETFAGGTAKTVTQGYWLIAETTTFTDPVETVKSLAILDTAGSTDITVTPKKDLPSITKEANHTTGDVGEEITFTLTGTTANYADSYEKYVYRFVDHMTAMTYVEDSVEFTFTNGDGVTADDFNVAFDTADNTLIISATDLSGKVTADTVITVKYKAVITADAVTEVVKNKAKIEYSNDPYNSGAGDGEPSTGETPPVEVIIDVVNIIIDKFDKTDSTVKLEGAKFQLLNEEGASYYWNETTQTVEWGVEGKGIYETDANGALTFKGLSIGSTYHLVEVEAPAGYNKLTEDIVIDIEATDATDGSRTYTAEGITFVEKNGTVAIENSTGTELPSTGGIGTTLFVVFGMIAVLGAGVFLVTNKRMQKENF